MRLFSKRCHVNFALVAEETLINYLNWPRSTTIVRQRYVKNCEFNFFKYEAISVTCSPPTLPYVSCFYLLSAIIQIEKQKLFLIYTHLVLHYADPQPGWKSETSRKKKKRKERRKRKAYTLLIKPFKGLSNFILTAPP